MALFKIAKGLKSNLPAEKTSGHCWYTVDDSLFYIDYEDENGEIQRKALNAKDAETLCGSSLATDDEIIEMLIQEDMFPVVTDSDGSVLADESNNILLW